MNKINKNVSLKLLTTLIPLSLIFSGCSAGKATTNENSSALSEKTSELLNNSSFDKTMDTYEITNKNEIKSLEKYNIVHISKNYPDNPSDPNYKEQLVYHKGNEFLAKDKLYNQKLRTQIGNLIKIDINKISYSDNFKDFNNVILAYTTKNIDPKLEVIYDDVILKINDNNRCELFGKIIVKNANLSEEDVDFLKEYSKLYPKRVKYLNDVVVFSFNIDDDHDRIE